MLHGIGEKTERRLWRDGVLTWNDFLTAPELNGISPAKKLSYDTLLSSASDALAQGDARYFARALKRRDHWRLFDAFKGSVACLDIETNGLMPWSGGIVTVIGIYNGFDYVCFVHGETLTAEAVMKELERYDYLVTFYGTGFDIPYLLKALPGLRFDIPHFDVCFGARSLGFHGGLKKLEAQLGISRDENVRHMDGYDAVKLWEYFRKGSGEALDQLILYNKEDTVNLYALAEMIYRQMRARTGIEEYL